MHISQQLFLLAFLAPIFHSRTLAEVSPQPNNVVEKLKTSLIREASKRNGNPSHCDDFVDQITSQLDCGSFPLSPNSHLGYSLDHTTKKLSLFQVCDRYFITNQKPESLQVECKNEKWVFNKIDCEKITCPPLTAPNGGEISTNDNTYNTSVYFWCSLGFNIIGDEKLTCQENADWNFPPPTCELSYCRRLAAPRNGFVSSQEDVALNQTVEFRCKQGYTLHGDVVLRCQVDGRWNTSAPVCTEMCTVPSVTGQLESIRSVPKFWQRIWHESLVEIENARRDTKLWHLSGGSLMDHGQQVIYYCKPGYAASSSGLSTCIRGTWKPSIHCVKSCAVKGIQNGTYSLSVDYSIIEYSCLPGYQLVGQQKLSCTPSMTWNGEVPICTKKCTLPERKEILSFRQKETYEIVPFETEIENGDRLYFVCRYMGPEYGSVTECVNGELNPNPCPIHRLESGFLEILRDGYWRKICTPGDYDLCRMFGYTRRDPEPCPGRCEEVSLQFASEFAWIGRHSRGDCVTCIV